MAGLRLEIRRLARSPTLHFLVLGGSLYLLRAGLIPPAAAPPPAAAAAVSSPARPAAAPAAGSRTVIVSAAQIERLREAWRKSRRSLPSAAEEARLIARLADEEMLYREALRQGLDRAEPVRQRLIQNMRFLKLDEGGGTPDLYAQAVEIGFDRTDPVVRRFLVQQMQLLARAGDRPDVFTDAELEDHLRRNLERFALPAFVRISHVFLDADRRAEALERDARRLLARLRAGHVSPDTAVELGDPFFPGHHPALAARGELAKIYGPDFAAAVMRLPAGEWSGPVRSAYGLHLVWVHERLPGEPPRLADVRSRLALELAHERQEARLAAYLREMRRRYEVRVELPESSERSSRREEASR
jgi:parvulin-like peptidyl-prolyl cis-trans isomerase-like protein